MTLGPRLALRTQQTLVISPQLRAAIKLLTLSNLELQNEVAAELESNPLLEMEGEMDGAGPDAGDRGNDNGGGENEAGDGADDGAPADRTLVDDLAAPFSIDDLDVDFNRDLFLDDSPADGMTASQERHDFLIDQYTGEEESLTAVLLGQAEDLASGDRVIAAAIIGTLDAAGYLLESLADIAARLGVTEEEAARVLALVQGFEPTGVAARSLAECLILQARAADRYDPPMAALLDHLETVATGDIATLCRLCDVDAEDMADMLHELRAYDPKPGLRYGGTIAKSVVPDVFVFRKGGQWVAELNDETLPRVVVNHSYGAGLGKAMTRKPESRFVRHCMSRGNWLVKTLQQRADTILKVASALVQVQQNFFEHGVQQLKPLTLAEIADAVGVHESTVSRAVSNKYLSCERGTFELKYFFTTAITNTDGSTSSALAVRERIRDLIGAEQPLKPLSDGELVALLQKEGHDIARRTVAKYRDVLGIPSSFDRRRQAKLRSGDPT